MHGVPHRTREAAVLLAVLCSSTFGSSRGGALGQGTPAEVVQQSGKACRALRDARIMRVNQHAPEATPYDELCPCRQGKHTELRSSADGVRGAGGIVTDPRADIRTQRWPGTAPSPEDAKAEMEDHRSWPPRLERGTVDRDYDEAHTAMGAISMSYAQSGVVGRSTGVISLNGDDWLLAADAGNVGRAERWFEKPRVEAKRTRVPWIIQDAFPGYHGVAWYWKTFTPPRNPHAGGRTLIRFGQVDYAADVWLNGKALGRHEGGESVFVMDATGAIRPGSPNLLAVRVLNPTHEPIDGIVLAETAHRNKALPYGPGSAWNQGGIMDDVELLLAPAVRVTDVWVRPDWRTGAVQVDVSAHSADGPEQARLEIGVSLATGGETVATVAIPCKLPAGEASVRASLRVPGHRLWDLKEPNLYRLTARLQASKSGSCDEQTVRFGFRDFRLENGAYRLNGKRVFVRSSHTGNCCPIGLELPHDPDYLRRDLINAKFMGFNMIRFIAGVPKRYQLDLCDEIGLMVYEESYAGWCMAHSTKFAERYNESVFGMVLRDRNHPSVVIWGLLNETRDGPVFRHAVGLLPELRKIDETRLVVLGSGRWNILDTAEGVIARRDEARPDPCVTLNPSRHSIGAFGIVWEPGRMAMHPGREGEYACVRWTAPETGDVTVAAAFRSIAEHATTDVHVLHNGRSLFSGLISVGGAGPEQSFRASVSLKAGDTLDFVCGWGNGDYGADTTAADITITDTQGRAARPTAGFESTTPPPEPWKWGKLAAGASPDPATFRSFGTVRADRHVGAVANPGVSEWQDILDDFHPYQRVPHTPDIIENLRTVSGKRIPTGFQQGSADPARFFVTIRDPDDRTPVFISEYGIGSAVDLLRVCRLYEQAGKPEAEDARLYASYRDRFLNDWDRWRMSEAFDRPEDFFAQSNTRMAAQRILGINALRANPLLIGYSLTGTLDQGMTAEGLWTTFRELKPGTADAVFDGFAPLRWSLFVEPVHVYSGARIRVEAILSNEDALRPGTYPVTIQVTGPNAARAFATTVNVLIPPSEPGKEPPFAMPVFAQEITVDGPPGRYRLTATFQMGAAAAGEAVEFWVSDREALPVIDREVTRFGEDPGLDAWLASRGIKVRSWSAGPSQEREVILASGPAPGAEAWRQLAERMARGASVVFLTPSVLSDGANPVRWLPLAAKGTYQGMNSWLYHKDEWCKPHLVFEGLPAAGLMDYTYYREVIPDAAFMELDPPDEAICGAIDASIGYASGLFVATYRFEAGRFVLNALRVRENLGTHPAADRLLLNMVRYASARTIGPCAELPAGWDEHLKAIGY